MCGERRTGKRRPPPFNTKRYNHTDCETPTGKTFIRAISVARRRHPCAPSAAATARADDPLHRPRAPPPSTTPRTPVATTTTSGDDYDERRCTLSNLFHFPVFVSRPNVALRPPANAAASDCPARAERNYFKQQQAPHAARAVPPPTAAVLRLARSRTSTFSSFSFLLGFFFLFLLFLRSTFFPTPRPLPLLCAPLPVRQTFYPSSSPHPLGPRHLNIAIFIRARHDFSIGTPFTYDILSYVLRAIWARNNYISFPLFDIRIVVYRKRFAAIISHLLGHCSSTTDALLIM